MKNKIFIFNILFVSFMMLCQAFTAADFSCCLFVGLSAFSFVYSKWNACSIGLKSGDWLGHCKIFHFFNLQKLLGCFCCMFWVIVHLYYDAPSNQLCAFDWIWAESIYLYTSEFIRLLLSSVTPSLNTSATGSHAWSCHHTAPPCFTDDVVCFGSWAVPSLLHTFFFPSFWYRFIFISAVQRMLFQKWTGFF